MNFSGCELVIRAAVWHSYNVVQDEHARAVSHAKKYDGALAQITEVYSRESESASKRKKFHHNRGCCVAAIISSIPPPAGSATPAPPKGRQALLEPTMDERLDVARNAAQQGSAKTAGEASEEDDSMASSFATSTSVQTGKNKAHEGAANSRSIEGAPAKKIKHNTTPEIVITAPHPI